MGLTYPIIDTLIREHAYRPITGDVVTLGRQTIYMTMQEVLTLLREHGVDISSQADLDAEVDHSTLNRLPGFEAADLITDRALFRLLGQGNVRALDHSDYEGAELIHDLTQPLPPEKHAIADFIVDGSTLDNVFDPALAIRTFALLLKPGGRLITGNMYSNHNEPYAVLPPLWYLDYFVVNGFADCKVYVLLATTPYNSFTIDLDALLDPARAVSAFSSPYEMTVLVVAEKGENSTAHISPSQQHYRSPAEWDVYRRNLQIIKSHKRPHVSRSKGDIAFFDVKSGHLFMNREFIACDPTMEMMRKSSRLA